MKINRFEDLECWQQARILVNMVYDPIKTSPSFQKDFRLVNQITGAAVSVMNNIVEGWASQFNAEFIKVFNTPSACGGVIDFRFLIYSRRSCAEIQNCLYVALDQEYINNATFEKIYNQALKETQIIDGLLRYLRSKRTKKTN
jgi:hypothetical protein